MSTLEWGDCLGKLRFLLADVSSKFYSVPVPSHYSRFPFCHEDIKPCYAAAHTTRKANSVGAELRTKKMIKKIRVTQSILTPEEAPSTTHPPRTSSMTGLPYSQTTKPPQGCQEKPYHRTPTTRTRPSSASTTKRRIGVRSSPPLLVDLHEDGFDIEAPW